MATAQLAGVSGQKVAEQTDGDLLRTFLSSNDQAAFEALVRRHGPMVLRACLRALGNVQDAEDTLQATFLVLAQQAAAIRKHESLASWLHGVAYRMAKHTKRAAARRARHESRANPRQLPDPALCAAWRELQVLLDEEIEALPAKLRGPFIACCLENKSGAEAARQLGLKEGTLNVRLSRARKLLQKRLVGRGVSLAAVLAGAAIGTGSALAALPHSVVAPTVNAAVQVASGQALAAGPVSAKVVTLVEGVTRAMFVAKCKTVMVLLVSMGVVSASLGVAAMRGAGVQSPMHAVQKDIPPKEKAKPTANAGGPPEIPAEVRQALERNARALAPIALTLEKQRTAPKRPTELTKAIMGTFSGVFKPCAYEYLSQDGLCYARFNQWVESRSLIPGTDKFGDVELRAMWQEYSWDGKSAYLGSESLQPQILSIVPFDRVASDGHFKILSWYDADDYFGMIGIAPPRTMPTLKEDPKSEVLTLLSGDGRVTAARLERAAGGTEDRFVIELVSGGKKHRFELDPSLGHAVRRHEVWAESGGLAVAIENSDFVKLTDPELWLPKYCHSEWHVWPWVNDKPSREIGMTVDIHATRLERTKVPPQKFTLKYDKPGNYISDARLPGAEKSKDGRVDYIVPANPANVKEAIRAAQEGKAYVPPRRPLLLWVLGGMLVLALVAICWIGLRRRRRTTTT